MRIKEDFLSYTKWGATKFTDYFSMPFKNVSKTDGLWKHLQEMRQKMYDAIAALVDGKVDKTQLTTTNETNKIPVFNKNGEISKKLFNRKVIDIPSFNYNIPNENFDIVIPCSAYRGSLKVKLTGEWSYLNCTGEFEKTFRLYASTTVINEQQSSYTSLESGMSNHFAILNATLQNGELHIRIAKLTSTVNIASGKLILEGEGGNVQDIDNAYVSGVYIADVGGILKPKLQTKGMNILVDSVDQEIKGTTKIKKSSTTAFQVKNDEDQIILQIDTINKHIKLDSHFVKTIYHNGGAQALQYVGTVYNRAGLLKVSGQNYQGQASAFVKEYLYRNDEGSSVSLVELRNVELGISSGIVISGEGQNIKIECTKASNDIIMTLEIDGSYSAN